MDRALAASASAFLKKQKYIELAMKYVTVVNMNGTTNSLTAIISPETDAVTARGILSAITIKPFVVARSFSVTSSICRAVPMGPAMFIKAFRVTYADAAIGKLGDSVVSIMNGIERY